MTVRIPKELTDTFINNQIAELKRSISECNSEVDSLSNRVSYMNSILITFQDMKRDHLSQSRVLNAQFGFEGSFLSSGNYAVLADCDNNIRRCHHEIYELQGKINKYNQRKSNDEAKKRELEALLLKTEEQRAEEDDSGHFW